MIQINLTQTEAEEIKRMISVTETMHGRNAAQVQALIGIREKLRNAEEIYADEGLRRYAEYARKNCQDEGVLEVDEGAVVSKGDDAHGAYVQAWVWIDDDDLDPLPGES